MDGDSMISSSNDETSPSLLASQYNHPCRGGYLGLYPSPIFSLSNDDISRRDGVLTPSLEENDSPTLSGNGFNLPLQYRDMLERYTFYRTQFQAISKVVDALREENAQLRISNADLTKNLKMQNDRVTVILEEFRQLKLGGDAPTQHLNSPKSVLEMQDKKFCRLAGEDQLALPKSISVRSTVRHRKLVPCRDQNRVSTTVKVGLQQHMNKGISKKEALEFEVYNQGMRKTELCNKWEDSGECPYGEQCQFAHGIRELRPIFRHPRYKTEVCRMVLAGEPCSYGHRCHFRHILPHNHPLLSAPTRPS